MKAMLSLFFLAFAYSCAAVLAADAKPSPSLQPEITASHKDTPCKLKPDPGLCEAYFPKYFYDSLRKKCTKFIWGGCGGVVPFDTLEECQEEKCDPCEQEPEAGPCRGSFIKYYFSPKFQMCLPFVWGGCLGNVPFQTLAECRIEMCH